MTSVIRPLNGVGNSTIHTGNGDINGVADPAPVNSAAGSGSGENLNNWQWACKKVTKAAAWVFGGTATILKWAAILYISGKLAINCPSSFVIGSFVGLAAREFVAKCIQDVNKTWERFGFILNRGNADEEMDFEKQGYWEYAVWYGATAGTCLALAYAIPGTNMVFASMAGAWYGKNLAFKLLGTPEETPDPLSKYAQDILDTVSGISATIKTGFLDLSTSAQSFVESAQTFMKDMSTKLSNLEKLPEYFSLAQKNQATAEETQRLLLEIVKAQQAQLIRA